MPSEPAPLFVTIRPPGRAPFRALTLDDLTAIVRTIRTRKIMGRLADTLRKATDAKSELELAVELDVVRYIDRVKQVHKRREDVFMKKHGDLDLDVTDLSDFETDLEEFAKNDRSDAGESSGDAYVGTNPPKR